MIQFRLSFKIIWAVIIICFSIILQNFWYHILVIALVSGLIFRFNIPLFFLPRQAWLLAIFTFSMFLLYALNGYGTVLFTLPLGITITEEGIIDSAIWTSRFVMIFLLFTLAIKSTSTAIQQHFFQSITNRIPERMGFLKTLFETSLLVVYLIPNCLEMPARFLEQVSKKTSITEKAVQILHRLEDFVIFILYYSKNQLQSFQHELTLPKNLPQRFYGVSTHLLMTLVIVLGNLPLIWV